MGDPDLPTPDVVLEALDRAAHEPVNQRYPEYAGMPELRVRTERVPLRDANGRVVARDIIAPFDVPPFPRAAMDGYAVRAADTSGATPTRPTVLTCIEKVFTGQMPARTIRAAPCA